MQRSELEHILRAAGSIAQDGDLIVIGSQSVLAQFPNAPVALLASMEADVYPRNKPERTDLIDGAIGEGSQFHEEFGYYAQGVDERTAILPSDWKTRLVMLANENTNGVTGWCLEVHDLAISKYIAGRPKDFEFNGELARHGMTKAAILRARLKETDLTATLRKIVSARIAQDFPDRRGN
jgi:hypothetical protein